MGLNRKGIKPDSLHESEKKPEPPKPIDLLEQESLTRFDKRKAGNDNRNVRKNENGNRNRPENRNRNEKVTRGSGENENKNEGENRNENRRKPCLLYTSPSPRDQA
eukprot:TRINITY_DN37845_c0_g1_i1.p3 TRINITY_DN37845_c0_g1~~TRINITY_DN37845_c0_g1_i1.p3  ORF type:complete len:106 (-),score=13.13 TRINITY_DN37845_c0_g1_i1:91-408(-)